MTSTDKHELTQDEDTQGYDDGLEEWTCSCGESFSAGEIDAAFQHGLEVGSTGIPLEDLL